MARRSDMRAAAGGRPAARLEQNYQNYELTWNPTTADRRRGHAEPTPTSKPSWQRPAR